MRDPVLAEAVVFEGINVPRGTPADADRWRSLVTEMADSLTRSAMECHDQLQATTDANLRRQLLALRRTALRCLDEVRAARESVDRAALEARGLPADLRDMARRFATSSGIDVDLRVPKNVPEASPEIAWALHSIADEAFDGLLRLSRATGVVLTLASTERRLVLTMRDDGVGLISRQGRGWRASPLVAFRTIKRIVEPFPGSARLWSLRPRGILLAAELQT